MRRIWLSRRLIVAGSIVMAAQMPALQAQSSPPAPPQSARQALIEMFTGKGENDFVRHLPDAARQTLIHKGETPETSTVLRISTIGRQLASQGERVETFAEGPNILVSQLGAGQERIEVAVERDSLIGENDEIELSIHAYKNGQPESLPVVPRILFTLRQEKEIWRLVEVTVAAHVPLTDPDYLQGLRKQQDGVNEAAAQARAAVIAAAETGYAAKHPESGYTCALSTLFARETQPEGVEGAEYFDPGQGNQESNGYHFALAGCDGVPASKYRLMVTPVDPDSSGKTFCADESGAIKSVTGGKAANCLGQGQVLNPGAPSAKFDD